MRASRAAAPPSPTLGGNKMSQLQSPAGPGSASGTSPIWKIRSFVKPSCAMPLRRLSPAPSPLSRGPRATPTPPFFCRALPPGNLIFEPCNRPGQWSPCTSSRAADAFRSAPPAPQTRRHHICASAPAKGVHARCQLLRVPGIELQLLAQDRKLLPLVR